MSAPRPRRTTGRGRPGSGVAVDDGLTIGGRRAVGEALRAGQATTVLVAHGLQRNEALRTILKAAESAGVPLRWVGRAELDELGLHDHQGVAAIVSAIEELGERSLSEGEFGPEALAVVLDGIVDPQNLGACARAAEAAGAALLVTRKRRAAPLSPAAIRASAGALSHLPVVRVPNIPRVVERLKDRGFFVVGLDHRAEATIHDADRPDGALALVVGSEERGITRLVRERCDLLVSIPMIGATASLNAAAALAVGLFAYARRPPRDR